MGALQANPSSKLAAFAGTCSQNSTLHPRVAQSKKQKKCRDKTTCCCSKPVDAVEVLHSLHKAVSHADLSRPQRHSRVVIFFVGLLWALGVTDLRLQVVHVLLLVLVHAVKFPFGTQDNASYTCQTSDGCV